jgi:hypothetical protein
MHRPLAGRAPPTVNPKQLQEDLQSAGAQPFNLPTAKLSICRAESGGVMADHPLGQLLETVSTPCLTAGLWEMA